MTLLDIDAHRHGDGMVHVVLSGELDLSTVEKVDDELKRVEDEKPTLLVLDLARVTFLDSSGLRMIVGADQRARKQQRRFAVVRGPESVQRVFSITHLDEKLEIVDDIESLALS